MIDTYTDLLKAIAAGGWWIPASVIASAVLVAVSGQVGQR